jgi:hypothetical protein
MHRLSVGSKALPRTGDFAAGIGILHWDAAVLFHFVISFFPLVS